MAKSATLELQEKAEAKRWAKREGEKKLRGLGREKP